MLSINRAVAETALFWDAPAASVGVAAGWDEVGERGPIN
jgi:hypothetical protein